MKKIASTVSTSITVVGMIEKIGRKWTSTLEILTFISLAIKVIQLSIIVGHSIVLYCNYELISKIEGSVMTKELCIWLLFYSISCLGIITCKGNNALRLIGIYIPLIIVLVVIYSWDHITRIGLKFRRKTNKKAD